MFDSGAGGGSWGHPRGVSGRPAEPQLELPQSRALPQGEYSQRLKSLNQRLSHEQEVCESQLRGRSKLLLHQTEVCSDAAAPHR